MAKILVVEDNPANLKLAVVILTHAGHELLCATRGDEGVVIARRARPDLILMDVQMPGMSGLEAMRLLKQDAATAAIPVIGLTAFAMKGDAERILAAGCDAYLAKPYSHTQLTATVAGLLGNIQQLDADAAPPAPEDRAAAASGRRAAAPAPPSRTEAPRQGRLILVAEDSATNQKLIAYQLALLGFTADVAKDGREALLSWRSGDYALLLADLHMPEMDGFQLTAAIRAEENDSRHIPIIALTADDVRSEVEHCRTVGMDDYLRKPAQVADLQAMLDKWLPAVPSSPDSGDSPVTPAAAAGPVNISILKALVGSDPEIVREFLRDFRANAAKITVKLRAACQAEKTTAAAAAARKLKSSARSVGALALGDLCAGIEQACKAGRLDELTVLLSRVEAELAAVDAYLGSLPANGAVFGG